MKILVVSDTHRKFSYLIDVMQRHSNAEIVIFLGDGEEDMEYARYAFPEKAVMSVRGNCDFASSLPLSDTFTIEGYKLFFAHGHTYNVKSTQEHIIAAARGCGAHICLFGHTHCPVNTYNDGLYIMNPGSLGHPRNGMPTYGLIDISPAGISMNIVNY